MVNVRRLILFCYNLSVCLLFLSFLEYFSPSQSLILSSLTWVSFVITSVILVFTRIVSGNRFLYLVIFLYVVLVWVSAYVNLGFIKSLTSLAFSGILYFSIFLTANEVFFRFGRIALLTPVRYSYLAIIVLSVFVFLGFDAFAPSGKNDFYPVITTFSGVFRNQNTLGMMAACSTMIFFHWAVIDSVGLKRIFLYSVFFVSLGFVVFTLSRASYLLVCLSFFIYLTLSGGFVSKFKYFVVFSLGIVIVLLMYPDVYGGIVLRLNDGTLSQRDVIWMDAFHKFINNYLVGVGPGIYRYEVGDFSLSAHNAYLMQLVNLGILGFCAWFFIIIYYFFKSSYVNVFLKQDVDSRIFYSLFVGILAHQVFESSIFSIQHPMTITLFVCMLISSLSKGTQNAPTKSAIIRPLSTA